MLIGTKFGIMKKSLHLKYRILFISLNVLDIFDRVIEKRDKRVYMLQPCELHPWNKCLKNYIFSYTFIFIFIIHYNDFFFWETSQKADQAILLLKHHKHKTCKCRKGKNSRLKQEKNILLFGLEHVSKHCFADVYKKKKKIVKN